ncbi:MAG: PAS domain S-box protein, partial [Planctomycetota bacterium]
MPTTNESPNVDQFTSPYFFFTYDQSGYLRFASQSVERVLGYSAAKIIGRHHGDFLVDGHELNQSVAECHERRFSQTGEHNSVRALVAQDGGIRIVSVQTVGITDANDRIVRCQGLAIDTTEDYLRNQALCA